MLLMLIVYKMNERELGFRKFRLLFHLLYLAAAALYFFPVWLLLSWLLEDMIPIACTYTACGFAVWNIFFVLNRRKLQKTNTNG
jgi:hypothetical protein